MTLDESALRGVAEGERHRFACLRVMKNNYGPTGAEVWLERVQGGALRVAALPTLNTPQGTAAPVAPQNRAQARQSGRRAAAMQAYAVEVLRYIDQHSDPMIGGIALSMRTLGRELWSKDASITNHGMLDRVRRVTDFCEAQGWIDIKRPDQEERGQHAPCTYIVTKTGKEQFE